MTEEIGLAQPVEYAEAERRTIATHESGHATVAWLVGKGRKMEVLSIIKRKDALGLLSHSEEEERYTKTRSEIEALIQIAFGGMVAEELFFGETSTGWPLTSRPPRSRRARWSAASAWATPSSRPWRSTCPATSSPRSPPSSRVAKRSTGSCARAHDEVRTMLEDNRHVVEALRDALLDRDELVGNEILDVIATAGPVASDIKA